MAEELPTPFETDRKADPRHPSTAYRAAYPYNSVTLTEGGHLIEIDSTPGNERYRIGHKSGTYTEISANGRKVEVVVGHEHKYHKGGVTISVDQNYDVKISGGQRISVSGDAHIEVAGNSSSVTKGNSVVAVNGNMTSYTKGNHDSATEGNSTSMVKGNATTSVAGSMTASIEGSMTSSVSGDSYMNTKGSMNMIVGGGVS